MRSFVKIKPSRNDKITLSFIDIGKSNLILSQIFHITNMYFNAIRKNKILAKISECTVCCYGEGQEPLINIKRVGIALSRFLYFAIKY